MLIQCPRCNGINPVIEPHPVCHGEVEWECPECMTFWCIETCFIDFDEDD